MAGAFAAVQPAAFFELLEYVAVADFGACERNAEFFKGFFQSEIAHQGADHARNRCGSVLGGGNGVQQLVAVVFKSARINHNQSVGVAIQRNAQVSVVFDHRSTQRAGRGRTDFFIDIKAVRVIAHRNHIGAQLMQYMFGNVVGRAVGGIDHDFQPA